MAQTGRTQDERGQPKAITVAFFSLLKSEGSHFRFREKMAMLQFNADLIAAGLSPFAPEAAAFKAGRLMLQEMAECVNRRTSFAFETTLSGLAYLRHIEAWRRQGYRVDLYFLSLPSVELAIMRVAERVRQGGHNIPEQVIRRRFDAGLANFENHYRAAVDGWVLYDNSGDMPVICWNGRRVDDTSRFANRQSS